MHFHLHEHRFRINEFSVHISWSGIHPLQHSLRPSWDAPYEVLWAAPCAILRVAPYVILWGAICVILWDATHDVQWSNTFLCKSWSLVPLSAFFRLQPWQTCTFLSYRSPYCSIQPRSTNTVLLYPSYSSFCSLYRLMCHYVFTYTVLFCPSDSSFCSLYRLMCHYVLIRTRIFATLIISCSILSLRRRCLLRCKRSWCHWDTLLVEVTFSDVDHTECCLT